MSSRIIRLVSLALVAVLAFGAVPAFAVDVAGAVPISCTVGGQQLQGLQPEAARALIRSKTPLPGLAALTLTAAGKTYSFWPNAGLVVDVEKMLMQAYDPANTGQELRPVYAVSTPAIAAWVKGIASGLYRKPVNAKYIARNSKMVVRDAVAGRRLNQAASTAQIAAAIQAALNAGVSPTAPVALTVTPIAPKITKSKLGKSIHVDLSDRRIRLYNKGRLLKKYRCAIGARGFATPRGSFKITAKRKNPTWGNPGSAWARSMPSFIGPGPSNPLGTRALNLNVSGIRIHGTSKRYSIGTAASHGCLRMLREDVEDLYRRVSVGTPVTIVK